MKLWKEHADLDTLVEQYTIGNDPLFDMQLAPYDVRASTAHANMLHTTGLISADEHRQLTEALLEIAGRIERGDYTIEPGIEDIHSQIEKDLIRMTGNAGKKIHTARSRNDQVLVALKLLYKDQLAQLDSLLREVVEALLVEAEAYREIAMPGYTHTRIAMPSSLGMWFACYAEAFVDDTNHFSHVRSLVDQNPLGSAAGYGSSFPIDRDQTTRELGFADLTINAQYAQMTRGKTELWIAGAFCGLGATIARFAADVCLFSSGEPGLIALPENITTGSSIMPHKRNPDVFELMRAHSNRWQSLPGQVSLLTTNLISGYHRDVQLLKEVLLPAFQDVGKTLQIMLHTIPLISPSNDLDMSKYSDIYSVEGVHHYVREGMSFRDAYHKISREIAAGTFKAEAREQHTHLGSTGNLGLERIKAKLKQ